MLNEIVTQSKIKCDKWAHQPRDITRIREAFMAGHRRVGYMLSTGGGKTRICAEIIKMTLEKEKKVMFVVNRKTLVNQASKAFDDMGIDHGIVQGDNQRYKPWLPVQICSIQSLMRRKQLDSDFVIVDEFHNHFKYMTELMEKWNLVKFLGVSATPFTNGLGKHWDHLVVGASTSELQEKGTLLPPIVYSSKTISVEGLKVKAGEYDKKQLAERVDNKKITADIVNTYIDKGENRKAICFPCNVNHSKDIVNEFNESGIPALHIDCFTPDPEREEAFEKHKTGEVQILSSVGVLQVGHDEKSIACVILARPIKSLILYIQCVGRGARSFPGLSDYLILDHGTNVTRLGWPDETLPEYLCDGKQTESQKDKENEEKKEKELKDRDCPECGKLVRGVLFECPGCGHLFNKRAEIEIQKGELVKLERKKKSPAETRNKETSKSDKQAFYSAALSHCKSNGWKEGWAANAYRDRFSVWPNAMQKTCSDNVCLEFENHLKHKRIAYAKRKTA